MQFSLALANPGEFQVICCCVNTVSVALFCSCSCFSYDVSACECVKRKTLNERMLQNKLFILKLCGIIKPRK